MLYEILIEIAGTLLLIAKMLIWIFGPLYGIALLVVTVRFLTRKPQPPPPMIITPEMRSEWQLPLPWCFRDERAEQFRSRTIDDLRSELRYLRLRSVPRLM